MEKLCAQCEHYIGAGDWDLCCKLQKRRLCHENDAACPEFKKMMRCINRTSYVGAFRCSICGKSCLESDVGDTCPFCGSTITGALWGGQKHYREGTQA